MINSYTFEIIHKSGVGMGGLTLLPKLGYMKNVKRCDFNLPLNGWDITIYLYFALSDNPYGTKFPIP